MIQRSFAALAAVMMSSGALAQAPENIQFPDRQTIELAPATERAFDRSGQYHVETALPGGIQQADHSGALQNITVARRAPDGTIETLCTDDREAALDFLAGIDRSPSGSAQDAVLPDSAP